MQQTGTNNCPELMPVEQPLEKRQQIKETRIQFGYENPEIFFQCMKEFTITVTSSQKLIIYFVQKQDRGLYTYYKEETTNLEEKNSPVLLSEAQNNIMVPQGIDFGYKGEEHKLKNVVNQLGKELDLVKQSECRLSDVFRVWLSHNYIPGSIKIYLDLETYEFRYILDYLQKYFKHLTYTDIERSQSFYTKDRTLITRNILSQSGKRIIKDPQRMKLIDSIMKQMF